MGRAEKSADSCAKLPPVWASTLAQPVAVPYGIGGWGLHCLFVDVLRAPQLSFGVLDHFPFSSLYNSTSRLNIFEKIASISVVKHPH